MKADFSAVFEKRPQRWGLRGDPYFWEELRESFAGQALPLSADAVVESVCVKFESVTGVPLTYDARPYVERYAHGGMSSGHVSGLFWIGRGMAAILRNYETVDAAGRDE